MTLTDFLLARIAEDEEIARTADAGPWYYERALEDMGERLGDWWVHDGNMKDNWGSRVGPRSNAVHIARHDPARVLAECEAKRRIVDDYRIPNLNDIDAEDQPTPGWIIKEMAAVYANHPDYLEEWRP